MPAAPIGNLEISDVTLAILAGGQGRRMGLPKSNLQIACKPILEYLLDQFAWPGPTLLVTSPGRDDPPGWQRFDRQVADPIAEQGPLRGLLTAMENCSTELLVVTTVDMPEICREQFQWLISRVCLTNCEGLMLRRSGGRIEPFPLACRRRTLPIIQRRLFENRNSIRSLADDLIFEVEDADAKWDPKIWTNLNTPDDLRAFEESHSKPS
jgi:molybdopterin-guanine dinucleotide biosynthesis protein A